MARDTELADSGLSDTAYQDQILPHVSRTFALTIPQLPATLRTAVTSAYLLCRIADTIEDEPGLPPEETLLYLERFTAVVNGSEAPQPLAQEVAERLTERTLPAERELVRHMERVIRVTVTLSQAEQEAIQRCIRLMCYGMHQFQRTASLRGLATLGDLDSYCYYVAGVVGEMLTELFCAHSANIERQRAGLRERAVSFAQGLQMTNILKDVWEDRSRGACWLPQEVFARHGVDLMQIAPESYRPEFGAAMTELVAVAHAHLRNALEFTLLIPRRERGIRRFCLWAIGLAVLTLRRIAANPRFTSGSEVKVSRQAVAMTQLFTGCALGSNWMLRKLFARAASGLPLASLPPIRVATREPAIPAPATDARPDFARRVVGAPLEAPRRRSDRSSAT
ncbi:MAG TPA: phytoene/squalene synthase family protein [Steroidobacteraceae bacterium]|jgi:farnesyl-diphosphate farnesyltransferase|nr:phytoene/squalene synthase family protein [Steroidobacteraceae bacterium]